MEEELIKEYVNNPGNIIEFIYEFNQLIEPELRKIDNYHNVISYFSYGQCNVYAIILYNIFNNTNEVKIFDNSKIVHVITQIGDYCYDVKGQLYKDEDYLECPLGYLYEPTITNGIGNYYPKIHDTFVDNCVAIGKKLLVEKLIKAKQDTNTNQKNVSL